MILICLILFTSVLLFLAIRGKQKALSILLGIALGILLLVFAAAAFAFWVITSSGM